jgi:diketogulonate reductase-like aldo/keto reductase
LSSCLCLARYRKSPAQIVIRWGLQKGNVVIPKTVTLKRLEENAAVFDFDISDEDMAKLEDLGEKKGQRLVNPPFRANGTPVFSD